MDRHACVSDVHIKHLFLYSIWYTLSRHRRRHELWPEPHADIPQSCTSSLSLSYLCTKTTLVYILLYVTKTDSIHRLKITLYNNRFFTRWLLVYFTWSKDDDIRRELGGSASSTNNEQRSRWKPASPTEPSRRAARPVIYPATRFV